MKFNKQLALAACTTTLMACNTGMVNTGSTQPTGGISVCQATHGVLNTIDQTMPTMQLWETVLRNVADSSNYALPNIPAMEEDTREYYHTALLMLHTTLQVQGCPSDSLNNIINREVNS